MRLRHLVPSVLLALVAACAEPPNLGAPCALVPPPTSPTVAVIQVPTIECDSRMCLREGGASEALCTEECVRDADCEPGDGSRCQSGYTCKVAFSVGAFAGRRLCVCDDAAR